MKAIIGLVIGLMVVVGANYAVLAKTAGRPPYVCFRDGVMWVQTGQYEHQPCLNVEREYGLQPFGMGAEDDDTAQLFVQPTQSPQVTRHGLFLQGNDEVIQGSFNREERR